LRPERFVTRKVIATVARIARGSNERLVLGDMSVSRDWGWAEEYVDGMWRMLQTDSPEDYVLATGETNSLQDFVAHAFQTVGLDWCRYVDSDATLYRPLELNIAYANPAKAANALGWRARTKMKSVVRKMLEAEHIP
jgi:GDPmannose 4,6-dehydratase